MMDQQKFESIRREAHLNSKIEDLVTTLIKKEESLTKRKVLCDRQLEKIAELTSELSERSDLKLSLEAQQKQAISEINSTNQVSMQQLKLSIANLSRICSNWEAKHNVQELELLDRLKHEQEQWDKQAALLRQTKDNTTRYIDLKKRLLTSLLPHISPPQTPQNSLNSPGLISIKLPERSKSTSAATEDEIFITIIREIEDDLFRELYTQREKCIGEVINLEVKHRIEVKHMEQWFEEKTGYKRMEIVMNEQLAETKRNYEESLGQLQARLDAEIATRISQQQMASAAFELAIKQAKRKADSDLFEQKTHFENDIIRPLQTELINQKLLAAQHAKDLHVRIEEAKEELTTQIQNHEGIVDTIKRASQLKLDAKTKALEATQESLAQSEAENQQRILLIHQLHVEGDNLRTQVESLTAQIKQTNADHLSLLNKLKIEHEEQLLETLLEEQKRLADYAEKSNAEFETQMTYQRFKQKELQTKLEAAETSSEQLTTTITNLQTIIESLKKLSLRTLHQIKVSAKKIHLITQTPPTTTTTTSTPPTPVPVQPPQSPETTSTTSKTPPPAPAPAPIELRESDKNLLPTSEIIPVQIPAPEVQLIEKIEKAKCVLSDKNTSNFTPLLEIEINLPSCIDLLVEHYKNKKQLTISHQSELPSPKSSTTHPSSNRMGSTSSALGTHQSRSSTNNNNNPFQQINQMSNQDKSDLLQFSDDRFKAQLAAATAAASAEGQIRTSQSSGQMDAVKISMQSYTNKLLTNPGGQAQSSQQKQQQQVRASTPTSEQQRQAEGGKTAASINSKNRSVTPVSTKSDSIIRLLEDAKDSNRRKRTPDVKNFDGTFERVSNLQKLNQQSQHQSEDSKGILQNSNSVMLGDSLKEHHSSTIYHAQSKERMIKVNTLKGIVELNNFNASGVLPALNFPKDRLLLLENPAFMKSDDRSRELHSQQQQQQQHLHSQQRGDLEESDSSHRINTQDGTIDETVKMIKHYRSSPITQRKLPRNYMLVTEQGKQPMKQDFNQQYSHIFTSQSSKIQRTLLNINEFRQKYP